MMGMDDRVAYLVLGCIIGFILGYFVRSLRDIRQTTHHTDEVVTKIRDESGFIKKVSASGIALFLVVALSFFASVQSQMNSNAVEKNQKQQKEILTAFGKNQTQQKRIVTCTQSYLSKVLVAVNERTTYSKDQSLAVITLQKAQAEFITLALQDPPLESSRVEKGLRTYLNSLNAYVEIVSKTANKQAQNAYPTDEALASCLSGEKEM